jgi:hypothetical protein
MKAIRVPTNQDLFLSTQSLVESDEDRVESKQVKCL